MYNYEVNPVSPFEVIITGWKFKTIYPFNTETNTPFQSTAEAGVFAESVIYKLMNPPRYEIWYHVDITGGDNKTPIGIRNDGVDSVTVNITARETEKIDSPIRPITDDFRVNIRTVDGNMYDVILLNLVDGVGSITYTDDNSKGNILNISIPDNMRVHINPDNSITDYDRDRNDLFYSVHIIGETQIVVYRVI